jgi:hypothetical protein
MLGHEQTSRHVRVKSVIPLKADIHQRGLHVRLVPRSPSTMASLSGPELWITRPHISIYRAHAEHWRTGLRYRSLRLSPHANVRRKASARSGERMPRFFMSALLSTSILPCLPSPASSSPRHRSLSTLRALRRSQDISPRISSSVFSLSKINPVLIICRFRDRILLCRTIAALTLRARLGIE